MGNSDHGTTYMKAVNPKQVRDTLHRVCGRGRACRKASAVEPTCHISDSPDSGLDFQVKVLAKNLWVSGVGCRVGIHPGHEKERVVWGEALGVTREACGHVTQTVTPHA